ncbi:MAG: hypothetical protein HXY42_11390 [Chloroflexi bacterium]|nr:hypothetical protein [Chloroflexota bacterium]
MKLLLLFKLILYRTFWIFYRQVRQEKFEILAYLASWRFDVVRLYGSE